MALKLLVMGLKVIYSLKMEYDQQKVLRLVITEIQYAVILLTYLYYMAL